MRRRQFIAGLGSAAAWPVVARTQQPAVPVIGFLYSGAPGPFTRNMAAFREGLKETGYIEGQNLVIEYRWAEGQTDRLPALAADLVRRHVAVIAALDSASALAAKAASTTIPVVFLIGSDPIKLGLVATFSRPGGNITGVSVLFNTLVAKQLEALREAVLQADLIGLLVNPLNPNAESDANDGRRRQTCLDRSWWSGSTESDLETVFVTLAQQRAGALVISAIRFSRTGSTSSPSWRHVKRCRRSTPCATSWLPAAW